MISHSDNGSLFRLSLSEMMPEMGLIFIPDISGFTRFVHETDFATGRRITYELLSAIIDQNDLMLHIAEIEGDAIFFYRYGPPPPAFELIRQYRQMLHAFNARLAQINALLEKELALSLKLIAHYGPIAEYDLKGFKKLYGRAVVEAHVLLKNEIASHSYALLTADLMGAAEPVRVDELPGGIQSQSLCRANGDIVHVCYTYFDFGKTAFEI
ncbi:hypothetical protein GCM10010967_55380 [Dyadobacter beijingensis]|uniref:DUF2652 domain-containing protein n=1 Tax=Dyadobacter beijingensis TaxID=365489 RepID=A0ABQ2IN73_9BACT|nr:DUF2652 domain-containing protein [Dyadobacter beijingensis]GGN12291.1 hypothetical protein GCM10010967_55380 [Dyadobacter beijingensis]